MSEPPSDPLSQKSLGVASGTSTAPLAPVSVAAGRVRGAIRWVAMAAAGASVSALLILENLQRPGYEVVLFSIGAVQWRLILHFVFLASACVAGGTVAHQLAAGPRWPGRMAGWALGSLLTVCGIAIGILFLLLGSFASVRQYVTITADDGTQFLVRAKTWHHTDYTILEPAEEWGPWYTDGASILTDDPNTALAIGEYVLQRTPSGYRLTFGSAPGDGRSYELEW
jgi:hypothetical protein